MRRIHLLTIQFTVVRKYRCLNLSGRSSGLIPFGVCRCITMFSRNLYNKGSNLHVLVMGVHMWFFTCLSIQVVAVDISAYPSSSICGGNLALICNDISAGSCCDFTGNGGNRIRSTAVNQLPLQAGAYVWTPNAANSGCGDMYWGGQGHAGRVCIPSPPTTDITGGSWSQVISIIQESDEDDTPRASNCTIRVTPTLMKRNATNLSWYPISEKL
ncbi:hypothetical protein Mapa_008926 [Marchantia paleacea]|nr:hypothetical protein Mapa_008926 [Marchantia paleacea]